MTINKDDYTPSAIEKMAGNPATAALAAALSAGFALTTPIAIFLPALANSLAAGRQQERHQRFCTDASAVLEELGDKLQDISDTQYQLINDAVVTALNTLDQRKLTYLRYAIRNVLDLDIDPVNTASISRIVRDISAEEAEFLLRTKEHLAFGFGDSNPKEDILGIEPDSRDGIAVDGLTSLGLLRVHSGGERDVYLRTENADVICKLLCNPDY